MPLQAVNLRPTTTIESSGKLNDEGPTELDNTCLCACCVGHPGIWIRGCDFYTIFVTPAAT